MFGSLLNGAWGNYFKEIMSGDALAAAQKAFDIVEMVLWIILAAIGAAGIIYSIYLGVKLARAEDQSKRDEAKKHLITVVIAIVVTVVLIVFFNTVLPVILKAVHTGQQHQGTPDQGSSVIGLLF